MSYCVKQVGDKAKEKVKIERNPFIPIPKKFDLQVEIYDKLGIKREDDRARMDAFLDSLQPELQKILADLNPPVTQAPSSESKKTRKKK